MARWRVIYDGFVKRIESGELAVGMQLPSELSLSEELGVARLTINRAYQELERMGFVERKRRWGTVVCERKATQTGQIALLFDYTNDFPQADLLRGIHSALGTKFQLVLCDAKGDFHTEATLLEKSRSSVDGILIYPLSDPRNTPLLKSIVRSKKPLVCIDRIPDGLHADAVMTSNFESSLAALKSIPRYSSTRAIFFSGDNEHVSTVKERYRAFSEVFPESIGTYERWFAKELELKPQRLCQAVEDALISLMQKSDAPTVLFSTQDAYTAAALDVLDAHPEWTPRLNIVTYNDWPAMMLRQPDRLHRVVQPNFDIGRLAAERLLARILDPTLPHVSSRLPAEFFPARTLTTPT